MKVISKICLLTLLSIVFFSVHADGEQWAELNLFDWSFKEIPYWATSEVQEIDEEDDNTPVIDGKFGPGKIFDGKFDTYWAEGSDGNGTGETVLFAVEPGIEGFMIVNGAVGRKDVNKIRKMTVSIFTGFSFPGYVTEIARGYSSIAISKKRQ